MNTFTTFTITIAIFLLLNQAANVQSGKAYKLRPLSMSVSSSTASNEAAFSIATAFSIAPEPRAKSQKASKAKALKIVVDGHSMPYTASSTQSAKAEKATISIQPRSSILQTSAADEEVTPETTLSSANAQNSSPAVGIKVAFGLMVCFAVMGGAYIVA